MQDFSPETWAAMAEFSNSVVDLIDKSPLTPPEIIVSLDMMSANMKNLLEAKKAVK